ncbi:MAG: hypothetical protein J6R92_07055, partial [Akkermansia sp.]|nr:hypothetical protein [Akkermansia sp.]
YKELKNLMPSAFSSFADNPRGKKIRVRFALESRKAPRHRACDYLLLANAHISIRENTSYAAPEKGNGSAAGNFIAPFSTLGKADQWDAANWQKLIAALNGEATLIAFEQDRAEAEKQADEWGIPCSIVKPETVAEVLGPQCRLFAVDGLMPQLAALVGCECRVIMASRLAAVYAPVGNQHKVCTNHTPCHPCYQASCDQERSCASGVSVEALLA